MSRPKKRTETGRLTKEAAEIVVEMLREGVVQGDLKWLSGGQTPPTFEEDEDGSVSMPYLIGDYWLYRDLSWGAKAVVGFVNKADRKEFKRRWRERYLKEVESETQVETKRESETELTYPLFAKSKKNGIVILFTSTDRGICVKSSWSVHSLGECSNNWVHATDKDWMHLTFAEAEAEIFGEKK